MQSGEFNFVLSIYDELLEQQKTCTCNILINKITLQFNIENYNSNYGENIKDVQPTLLSNNVDHLENANVKVVCDVNSSSNVGDYSISLQSDNDNYIIIFNQDAKYSILPIDISAEFKAIKLEEYDGQNHIIEYEIKSNINQVDIYYSFDNKNYFSDLKFKDVINCSVYIRVEPVNNINYNITSFETMVYIPKRKLIIELKNSVLSYNFEIQTPKYEIHNLLNSEEVKYNISGSKKSVGKHILEFNLLYPSSNNYEFETSSFEYEITKLIPKYEVPSLTDSYIDAVYFRDIELPKGFKWKNPDEKLRTGTNIGQCIYTPENTEIYEIVYNIDVVFTKYTNDDKYALLSIAGIAILSICSFVIFVTIKSLRIRKLSSRKLY